MQTAASVTALQTIHPAFPGGRITASGGDKGRLAEGQQRGRRTQGRAQRETGIRGSGSEITAECAAGDCSSNSDVKVPIQALFGSPACKRTGT